MGKEHPRLGRERKSIRAMIDLYCRSKHGGGGLCGRCRELQDFAFYRLGKCPYQEHKPTCANCPIHCYKPEMRERIREVMRFSGPRLMPRHPYLSLMHILDGFRKAPDLKRLKK